MKKKIGIVIGTHYQSLITDKIYNDLKKLNKLADCKIISLEKYYRFGIKFCNKDKIIYPPNLFRKGWHDCNKSVKIIYLLSLLCSFLLLSKQIKYFIFFEDSGVLEYLTIKLLLLIGCKVVILQDGIKSDKQFIKKNSSFKRGFGKSGANLYLIRSNIYKYYILKKSKIIVVGSPFNYLRDKLSISKNKILLIHQCFHKYKITPEQYEIDFYSNIARICHNYGPVELRIHPQGDPSRFLFLRKHGIDITWREKDISQSIAESNIVASVSSSAIADGILSDKIVIILDWHISEHRIPYRRGVTVCRSIVEFSEVLNRLSLEPQANKSSLLNVNEKKRLVTFWGTKSIQKICSSIDLFLDIN